MDTNNTKADSKFLTNKSAREHEPMLLQHAQSVSTVQDDALDSKGINKISSFVTTSQPSHHGIKHHPQY